MKIRSTSGTTQAQTEGLLHQEKQYSLEDQRSAEEAAEEVDCTVEYSDAETIQLDIDTQENFDLLGERLDRLYGALPELSLAYSTRETRPSKTAGHWHVTFKLPVPVSIERRILIQALLGSDLTREALNLSRYMYGAENPIRLFRPKEG